jgi:two-component system, chemotaxis family, sensor kinase Cph1
MNPLTCTNDTFKLSPATLVKLEDCSEDAIYAPGYIQPYGMILVLQESSLNILQLSQNVEAFFGIPTDSLLGKPLHHLFSETQVQSIRALLQKEALECCHTFQLRTKLGIAQTGQQKRQTFRSTLHYTTKALILELEPLLPTESNSMLQMHHGLQSAILKLRSANTLIEMAQLLATEIKAMTGLDRVMIYRFEEDDHGVVVAEAKADHLESYLGLHYPATDISAPARTLFHRNWVRHIPDVNHLAVPLLSDPNFSPDVPTDLSDCILRGVSPCHVEYLQNMGVAGSLTISLISDKRLWGLIACHHYSPRLVDYETRRTCELLGQIASIELVHQQNREESHYRTQVKAIQNKLQQTLLKKPNFIQQVLTSDGIDLLNLVHAEGVAICMDQHITLTGQTPSLEAVQALLGWLSQHRQREIYVTNCLARFYPLADALKDTASGVLAISIVLHQKSYHLLWFRPEQIHTVNWAGSPEDVVEIDELGNLKLCPRQSFSLWQETVKGTSQPWQPAEIEAAQMMRNTLMLAVLEFSQAALEEAAERAAIANRAKSQFLAKMSHELRTPLNAILGFTQIITRDPATPHELQDYLGIINRSGEHLLALINDVLEMSRIEAGELVLTEHSFNLHRFLKSLYDMFALKASEKGISLIFKEDPDLPHYICSDEGKLRQILINLIGNAIKFTDEGGVTLRAGLKRFQQTRQQGCKCFPQIPSACCPLTLSFSVEDTGCGIASQNWDSIFEAFIQTDQGRHAEGTGLGLPISRQFARLMGGDITVQSTVNHGSIFTCQVVCQQPLEVALLETETTQPVIGLEPGQPAYRILVVEDVPENCQLLTILLESVGFEVAAVDNGSAAIAHWQSWHPHLILMDIQMPVMDGYEAARQIRLQEAVKEANRYQNGSQPHPTKIIALTAYAFETDRDISLEAGCDDYLSKPFSEAVLFELISRYLGVKYTYAESVSDMEVSLEQQRSLTPQDLEVMSPKWVQQLRAAALDLRDDRVRQLIAEIPPQETVLIEGLSRMVNDFQLQEIAALTQLYGESKGQ